STDYRSTLLAARAAADGGAAGLSPELSIAYQAHLQHPVLFGVPIVCNVLAASITAAITWLLVRGVKESARFTNVIVVLKVLTLRPHRGRAGADGDDPLRQAGGGGRSARRRPRLRPSGLGGRVPGRGGGDRDDGGAARLPARPAAHPARHVPRWPALAVVRADPPTLPHAPRDHDPDRRLRGLLLRH